MPAVLNALEKLRGESDKISLMPSAIITAELLSDARAVIGEGPVWDARERRLIWVDIAGGIIHKLDPRTGVTNDIDAGQPVGAVALCEEGGLIAAVKSGFGIVEPGSTTLREVLPIEESRTQNRMNDGKCDCHGRFWAGTLAIDHTPEMGTLYRLERVNGAFVAPAVLHDVTISNGLDWSPDNRLMYYIDSPTQRIDVFDFDAETGSLRNRREFVEISGADGLPDGMTVDADGCLWVALFRGGKVRRYTAAGRIDMEVKVPVTLVTSCAFGGPDLDELYVTTARHRLTPAEAAEQKTAGGVFVCRPGPTGRLPFLFK